MFCDPTRPFTATIEADTVNGLWPEFTIQFRPPIRFEVVDAIGNGDNMLAMLKDKIISWQGIKADEATAAFISGMQGNPLKRTLKAGDAIPYHPELLELVHSVCLGQIWRKVAGFLPLNPGSTATTHSTQEAITKN